MSQQHPLTMTQQTQPRFDKSQVDALLRGKESACPLGESALHSRKNDHDRSAAHLAYAPRGAGLLYGVLWFAVGPSIYGWYIGLRDGLPEASYFTLFDYYAVKPAVLYRSIEDELHGPLVQITE